ncbi:hypothetical protein [Actinomadura macrotermitis]|uniref:Secreted protein n=1 Tax=Actinomadura macrotermitis TaxID=2585200 RepID=A0A7K0C0M9_9ACTN|nr:hypothetical protein [Actinomadura macrotermitis]MQY07018.1 hypothetical protein [Actinomadura macrotermitis]
MRALPRRRTAAALTGAALAALAVAGPVGTAAADEDPLPPGLDTTDCPTLPAGADPAFWQCTAAVISGGRLTLGKIDQVLDQPIKLTYANGFDPVTGIEGVTGGTLRSAPLRVPGGVLGIPGTDFIPLLQISAQPELTAPVELAPYPERGSLVLRMRIKVINPLLGDKCYIGSKDDPITLRLGISATNPPPPNTPIEGEAPEMVSFDPPVLKATMVDNEFAVPKSNGCGPFGLLNPIADFRAGLPSAAGHNTAIFTQYALVKTYTDIQQTSAKYRLQAKSTATKTAKAKAKTWLATHGPWAVKR